MGYGAFEFADWWKKYPRVIQAIREKEALYVSGKVTRTFELTDPAQRSVYLKGLRQAIGIACMLGCNTFSLLKFLPSH